MNKEERLIIIRDCLKSAASNWYSTIKFQIRDYADFRNEFIDEFWSRQSQIHTWSSFHNTTDKSIINAMKVLSSEESRRNKQVPSTTENSSSKNNQKNNNNQNNQNNHNNYRHNNSQNS